MCCLTIATSELLQLRQAKRLAELGDVRAFEDVGLDFEFGLAYANIECLQVALLVIPDVASVVVGWRASIDRWLRGTQ